MKDFWNERFDTEEYIYGVTPNEYLKTQLAKEENKGRLLMPAEGEGRNAVYAATQGWEVHAFDVSDKGRDKALKLAADNGVIIDYKLGNFMQDYTYPDEHFDAVGLIYSHFTGDLRHDFHKAIARTVMPGGIVIMEAFCKQHLQHKQENPGNTSGPGDLDLLISKEELLDEFKGFEMIELEEKVIDLAAGIKHDGTGYVIRMTARKR